MRTLGCKCERGGIRIAEIDRRHPSSKLRGDCGARNDTLTLAGATGAVKVAAGNANAIRTRRRMSEMRLVEA